ncbi:hypothetical protein, partial [Nocardia asteroides]|uniref:hypothetical protein n=1 Tax=Nocardia asteroides TaxID=1824 RepID=UPI0036461B89
MARQGEFGELDPGLPQAQAELAIAVRDLILQTEFSIWKVAQKLGVDKGVISRLASGARKRSPDLRLIKDLHDLAITRTERTDRSAEVIPWEHLEAMCSLRPAGLPVVAVPAVCGSCGTTCVPCSSGLTAAFDLETAAIQQEIGGALVAPVPRKEGDLS